MPMRHGLTLGEMGHWFIDHFKLDVDYRVIEMEGWQPDAAPGFGWPPERVWINPSPNAANVNMARAYAGTVMLEGHDAVARGGARRARSELFGAPDIDARAVIAEMRRARAATGSPAARCATSGSSRPSTSMSAQLCAGVFIHAEGGAYDHEAFRPWRLQALAFKAIRALYPDYDLWRDFPYEYEFGKLAIDVINGSPLLREWVDDAGADAGRSRRVDRPRRSRPGPRTRQRLSCSTEGGRELTVARRAIDA